MRTSSHWTWRLLRWCKDWHSPRRQRLFHKLRLEVLWTQLDPVGYGILSYYKGTEVIWLWPSKRAKLKGKWYTVELGCAWNSLAEIDKFWDEYSAACRAAAIRNEAAREDVYF